MANKDDKDLKWMDKYPISHPDHIHGLDTRAAIHEWQDKMPRHEAEAQAHKDYMKDQLIDSAAHHLTGIKAAHAAGDVEATKKHGLMYTLARKALGHENALTPDPEIENRSKHTPAKLYKFKNHISDRFLLADDKE